MSAESAQLLAFRGELGDYFETALGVRRTSPRRRSPTGSRASSPADSTTASIPLRRRVTPGRSPQLVEMVSSKRVSVGAGRQVLDRLVAEGGDPAAIVQAEGLQAIGGSDELAGIVAAALAANPDAAERVREGNAKAIGPIVGHVMRETHGRADGGEVTRLVHEQLGI